ncbi:dihydrolipoamide acetyltransferase, partial [Trypanosoma cruzi]
MRRSFLFLVNFSPLFMPALSPSMETGTIVEWKKKVGDLVNENEVFCTVQTDKAVVDYTNTFDAGYLAKILCHNGETVPVAKTIAVMVEDEADIPKIADYRPEGEGRGGQVRRTRRAISCRPRPRPAAFGGQTIRESLEDTIAASGPAVLRIAARLDRKTLESLPFTGKGGRFAKCDFVGQPGFNDDDVPPPPAPSPPSSAASAAVSAKNSGATRVKTATAGAASSGSVVGKAFPVCNLKVSDTTLLQQL